MINGTLNLNHPALNLRSDFKKLCGEGETKVAFLHGAEPGLAAALKDCCDFNTRAQADLGPALERYRHEKAGEPAVVPKGPVLPAPAPSQLHLQGFRAGKGAEFAKMAAGHSERAMWVSQQLAMTVTGWVGPAIMTSCKDLGQGLVSLQFSRQTSVEFLQDYNHPQAVLTGGRNAPGSREHEKLPTGTQDNFTGPILFDPNNSRTVLVDATRGVVALRS